MATEFKLNYSGSEINRKLATVDETKSNLENNYYTSAEIDTKLEEVNNDVETLETSISSSLGEINTSIEGINSNIKTSLAAKADLVNGKIPLEQLPDDIGSGEGLTEVNWADIKDKPFYEEGFAIVWDGDTTGKTTVRATEGVIFTKVYDTPFSDITTFVGEQIGLTNEGNLMSVTIESEYIEVLSDNINVILFEGEFAVLNVLATDTLPGIFDEPVTFEAGVYFLGMFADSADKQAMVYVSKLGNQTIKQIDPKFIPTNINGGLTEVSWEDIKNRPFYEDKAFEDIVWDGNTDGLLNVSADVNVGDGQIAQFKCYKISDEVFSKSQIVGSEIIFIDESGYEHTYSIGSLDELPDVHSNGSFLGGDPHFFIIAQDNTMADLSAFIPGLAINFAEKGIWFLKPEMGGMIMYYTIGLISGAAITKIDMKYLPTDTPDGLPKLDYAGTIPDKYIRKSDEVSYSSYPITASAVYNALGNYYTKSQVDTAIANKQINVDSSVISGSNNAVSGGAVYNAIQKGSVPVTSSDNGKFMRVVDGAWAAVALPNAEDGEF